MTNFFAKICNKKSINYWIAILRTSVLRMTQPRSLAFPRNDKVLKFSFRMLLLLLLYCHCERQRSNPVKSCKFYLPPWRGGTEFPTIYCRWNDGGGGKVSRDLIRPYRNDKGKASFHHVQKKPPLAVVL